MIDEQRQKELGRITFSKDGEVLSYIPMTERVRALRSWPEYDGYGIDTSYEIKILPMFYDDLSNKIGEDKWQNPLYAKLPMDTPRCIAQTKITDTAGRIISSAIDSVPYFSCNKKTGEIMEDSDFVSKAESGSISRALQNLGISLPTKEELQEREDKKNAKWGNKGNTSSYGNTKTPTSSAGFSGQGNEAKDKAKMIEQHTQLSIAELEADGGVVVEFETGKYILKYNKNSASYFWLNTDENCEKNIKYISTTVK